MPGTLIRLSVKTGDEIKKGAMVCIVEAMKMEVLYLILSLKIIFYDSM